MSRRGLNILGILILMGITAAGSVTAYILLVGGSGEASEPISAPTLSAEQIASPTPNLAETRVAELSTQVAALQATMAAAAVAPAESTAEPTIRPAEITIEPAAAAEPVTVRYGILSDQSQVKFTLTEDLRGTFTTVVGVTKEVAGEIFVDFNAPANSRVGVIRINARTLATDNEFRNRAIRGEILESSKDQYQYIDFTPTALTGLPASVAPDEQITFQMTGDLKIRDIVQPVTFDVTASANPTGQLTGSAKTTVTRTQFNLQIPSVPGVANVSDEVTLEITFVAAPVQ